MIVDIETHLKSTRHKWLVTGAAGFIGGHLVERLIDLGQDVIGLDNLSTGSKVNVDRAQAKAARKQYQFVEGDVLDSGLCEQLIAPSDYILHHAAFVSVPKSVENPQQCNDTNVNGFKNILVSALGKKVKKIVYASSSAVYGNSPRMPKVESDLGMPLSPYAASKQANEVDADLYFRAHAISVLGLRYFNVFGPYQDPNGPYAAVIPQWMHAMRRGDKIYINGDGSNTRDFCFIQNVVDANLLAAFSGVEAEGKVFNIACGEKTTLLQLYSTLKRVVTGSDARIQVEAPVHRPPREGDIPHSHADITLARDVLRYQPHINLEEGLRLMVKV